MNNNTLHKLTKNMTVLDAAIFKGKRGKFLSTQELRALALFAEDAIQSLGKPWQEIAWIEEFELDPWNVPEQYQ